MILLDGVGLATPGMANFVQEVDGRVKGGWLRIAEDRIGGGNLQLRYDADGVSVDRLQLHYKPDDSNMEYTASSEQVLVRYKYSW